MQQRASERRRGDHGARGATPDLGRDRELDLVELWLVLRRRWLWLMMGLMLGLLGSGVYVAVVPPVYQSRASIYLGNVGDVQLESPDVLRAQLLERYGLQSERGDEGGYLQDATLPRRQNELLILTAASGSPETARDFLAKVVSETMQSQESIFQASIGPLRREFERVEERIGALMAHSAQLAKLIAQLREAEPLQAAVVAIDRGALFPELNQLQRDRMDLQRQISRPYSLPSEVITAPTLDYRPVAPDRAMSIAIGAIIGISLGVLVVFFVEFLSAVHRRAAAESTEQS